MELAPSLSSSETPRDPFCIGYIIIPQDINRDLFIQQCLSKNKVSFVDQNNNYYQNVDITEQALSKIKFPKNSDSIGSTVLVSFLPVFNLPIITGTFANDNEFSFKKENTKTFLLAKENSSVSVSTDASGALSISIDGSQSELDIKINSKNKNSKFNLYIDGQINLFATDKTNLETVEFILNKGEEPMVLGQILKDFLDKFIDTVSNATVTTGIGQMPLLNKAKIIALKKETGKILSKIGFLK